MKKTFIFSLVFLLSYGSLKSQESLPRVGIGLEAREYFYFIFQNNLEQLWPGAEPSFPGEICHNIYIPINFGKSYRLEPQLGFNSYSKETEYRKYSLTSFKFGIGFFQMKQMNKATLYYGMRLALIYSSETSKDRLIYLLYAGGDKKSGFGFIIAPAIGGEYFVCENISLGCEVQFKLLLNNLDNPNNNNDYEDTKQYSTNTLFFTRFYF